jgi:hypothetical protein
MLSHKKNELRLNYTSIFNICNIVKKIFKFLYIGLMIISVTEIGSQFNK